MAVEDNNIINYKFYEKPMSANTVLHARTAMAEDAKIRCLANDLTRRMLTSSERIPMEVRRWIVDEYAQKLLNSGYSLEVTRRIIVAGLKGYERKLMNSRKPGGKKLLRTAKESYEGRVRKKLMAKTNWFKKRPREDDEDELENILEGWKRRKTGEGCNYASTGHKETETLPNGWKNKENNPKGWKNDNIKTRSTIFIIGSKYGNLAKRLRGIMERLKPIVGFNAKIIEKTGQKIRNTLSNSDPWKGMECGRYECLTCSQEEEQKLDCRKRSLIYENICELCNPREEKNKNKSWEDLRDKRETPSI